MAQLAASGVEVPEEFTPLEAPPAVQYIWGWYAELASGRQQGFSGPAPVSWQEMQAWAELMRRRPSVDEIWALRKLDEKYLEVASKGG